LPERPDIRIPFGTADPAKALAVLEAGGRETGVAVIETGRTEPLRLHHGPYDFRATPGLGSASDTQSRLDLIRGHLSALCDLWAKHQRAFIDAYFDFITAEIEAHEAALAEDLAPFGGLYEPADWAFSALRPLPRAHIALDRGRFAALDMAFFDGTSIVGITVATGQSLTKGRLAELDAVKAAGVTLIEIENLALNRDGAAYLTAALPETFHRFWQGEVLPVSPFKPSAIAEVAQADITF
jgi:hypothetical protein